MSWTKEFSVFAHGLLVTPIILIKFTHAELSFWYLLQIMISFGLLSEAGFAHTLQRAVAFFYAGANKLPRNSEEFKNSQEESGNINFKKLEELLYTVRRIYLFLSVVTLILLGTIGLAILWNNLVDSGHRHDFWLGFFFMVINAFITIQSLKWSSFMMGTRHVAELNGFRTIVGAIRIIGFLCVLLPGGGLEYLMLYLVLEIFVSNLYYRSFVTRWFKRNNILIKNSFSFNKEIFNSLWSVTWKSGLNTWGFFFTQYGVSLIIAQINDKVLMANFLFTQRMLGFIKKIGQAPVFSHFPKFYSLMSVKKYQELKIEASPKILLSYLLIIAGFVSFGLLGNFLLDLINSDKRIVEASIYIAYCIYLFFEWNALIHGTLYISTNSVPFLIPGLLTGAATLGIGFIVHPLYGIIGLILMQIILNSMCNFWFSTLLSLRLIKWPFLQYLSNIFIDGTKYWFSRTNEYLKKII